MVQQEISHHAADHGRQARQQVEREGTRLRESRVEQHDEIANFLRNLMRGNRQRRHHADLGIGQEGGGNHDAIGKVVEGIPDEDGQAAAARFLAVMAVMMVVPVALMVVRVAQQRDLLQQEEAQQAGQQCAEQRTRVCAGLERLGQRVKQRRGQQHPYREAHHALDHARGHGQRQQRRPENAPDARNGRRQQDVQKRGMDDGLPAPGMRLSGPPHTD
ncbi:hypothetical protein D3C86_1521480 [compost metagenome]